MAIDTENEAFSTIIYDTHILIYDSDDGIKISSIISNVYNTKKKKKCKW